MKKAFRLCGVGTEDIPVGALNSSLQRLLLQFSSDPDDFDEDVFLDDEDVFELEDGTEQADDADDDSAGDATGQDMGQSVTNTEV